MCLMFQEIKINGPNDFFYSKFLIKQIRCNCKCAIFDVVSYHNYVATKLISSC